MVTEMKEGRDGGETTEPGRAGEIVRVPACHMVSRQAVEQDRRMKK